MLLVCVFLCSLIMPIVCTFPSPGGMLLPPQRYGPPPIWGMTLPPHHPSNQPFYGAAGTFPGAARPQPVATLPGGSHNQFVPLQVNLTHMNVHRVSWPFNCCNLNFNAASPLTCQVTKKRVSANKKHQETREFYSAAETVAKIQSQKTQGQNSSPSQAQSEPQNNSFNQQEPNNGPSLSNPSPAGTSTAAAHTPPRQGVPAAGHTPGSASKRKHRKLAVNFEAAKVSQWAGLCLCISVCVSVCYVFLGCCFF